MAPLRALADRHGLRVVGDAAQAHGAMYRGAPIAAWADITCFSFYPGKNLGAYGDAGALVTSNEAWAAKARMIANHGRTTKYDHEFEGVNSRLDGLQAAVLSVKLRYLEGWTARRRQIARLYNAGLAGLSCATPTERAEVRAVYHLYVVRVEASQRDSLQAALDAKGIATGVHYPIALPYLNAYRALGHTEHDFPASAKACTEVLSLPNFAELTDDQVQYVVDETARALSRLQSGR
jgi:dTDP-4-amino-4,6-dideoxygalactose transaminase